MCNRYRLTAKQADVVATFGIRPPRQVDQTSSVGDVLLTAQKTPFHGAVLVHDRTGRRLERMACGVPTQAPGERDASGWLTKCATNVRNPPSGRWRPMRTMFSRRRLMPFMSLPEHGAPSGENGVRPPPPVQLPIRPVPTFGGIWR